MIRKPYLLFLGDAPDQLAAKVGHGINHWRPGDVVGQLKLDGCEADLGIKNCSLVEAYEMGARTLVVSVANRGGVISESWKQVLVEATGLGFDLASGLHSLLRDEPDVAEAARRNGRSLHDVRVPAGKFPIADGRKRSGKRLLAVGTDVSIGKMFTALAIHREMESRGIKATFRATGQTGILIEGNGVPLDAVVADFMSGAVEQLTPDNDPDHWDIIEGQGSLFHISYSGITLALVHGGQPDALILCHDPSRTSMRGLVNYEIRTLEELRETALNMARFANPDCRAIGIALNTSSLPERQALDYIAKIEDRIGLPAVDPVRNGAGRLVDELAKD
ncbi:MAG: DUF1611 domain-containing protein [Albidovulum sp.]|nr:DUF1611 domain-containing protein [Albidovulum sp.]MDE0531858.1 DUF1611 domain-containing protein [Albidovulum sp.]